MRIGLLVVAVVSCSTPRAPNAAPSKCALKQRGLVPKALVELSGLAASRVHEGVLYAHNDSGDSARFFAMSSADAHVFATFTLPTATAADWEEVSVGPCPSGSCVFLGDIGDNRKRRGDYAVYRTSEPKTLVDAEVTFERFGFEYPGGAKHNAEAMVVHPTTGRLYVLTKEDDGVASHVYRFPEPMNSSETVTLVDVSPLSVPMPSDVKLTAASVHPSARSMLLRMYNRLVELRLPEGESDFEKIFVQPPNDVSFEPEPQGEAVTYSADGRTYFTASERVRADVPLYQSTCP